MNLNINVLNQNKFALPSSSIDDKIMKKTKNKKQEPKIKEVESIKVPLNLKDFDFKNFRDRALNELSLKLKETKEDEEKNLAKKPNL